MSNRLFTLMFYPSQVSKVGFAHFSFGGLGVPKSCRELLIRLGHPFSVLRVFPTKFHVKAMVAFIGKQHQVIGRIIESVVIHMVYLFSWLKVSPYFLFHHKAMFHNITSAIFGRMVGREYAAVSVRTDKRPTLPVVVPTSPDFHIRLPLVPHWPTHQGLRNFFTNRGFFHRVFIPHMKQSKFFPSWSGFHRVVPKLSSLFRCYWHMTQVYTPCYVIVKPI